jgi:hypothetical protein
MSAPVWVWPTLIIASAGAAALARWGPAEDPARPLVEAWFLLVCPGMALVRLLRLPEPATELLLAVALSLALDALLPGTMLYLGLWSPAGGLLALTGVSLAGACLQLAAAGAGRMRESD